MVKTDEIFELVKSLTANEKRFFQLFGKLRKGDKNYMKVFSLMDKMKVYDSKKITSRFSKSGVNVSSEKKYLQKQIMKSLRVFHNENSPELVVNSLLQDIEILLNHRQFTAAAECIEKVKTLTLQLDLFQQYLIAVKWESRLALRKGDYNYLEKRSNAIYKKEAEVIEQLLNLSAYRSLNNQVFALFNRSGNLNEKQKTIELNKLLKNPLLQDVRKAKSFLAKIHFHQSRHLSMIQKDDFESAYIEQKNNAALFERDPIKITQFTQAYAAGLAGLGQCCMALEKYEELLSVTNKMEGLLNMPKAQMTPNLALEIRVNCFEKRMMAYVFTRRFNEAVALCKTISPSEFGRKNFELLYHLFTAIAYFSINNYSTALRYVKPLMDSRSEYIRMDYVFSAHFLFLAIQFELGNLENLSSYVKSSRLFFKTRNAGFKCSEFVFSFFEKASKAGNKKQLEALYRSTKESLTPLQKFPSEKLLLENFDIITWLESKC